MENQDETQILKQKVQVLGDDSSDPDDETNAENEHRVTLYEGDTTDFSGSLIGVKRRSFKEMHELYSLYARDVGFTIRKNTQRTNSVGVPIEKYYVCSNEGFKRATKSSSSGNQHPKKTRKRSITRTNCKASLRVKLGSDGLFAVVEHHTEHNHELTRKELTHMHRSHRSITNEKDVVIEDMLSSGMRASDSYRFMAKDVGGEHLVGHTKEDHLNYINRMKMNMIEAGDAQTLINTLAQQGVEDGDFFYRVKLDDEGRLSNVFWRDSMMKEDYQIYGDVVVFDTTYRTNKYNLICAPFVGVNNHWKNVMFGCAFIADEKIETFEWLFEVFKKSMKLKCPVTIFTDQDLTISNAIPKVFPGARHRLCLWNLYQNAVSRFGELKGNEAFNLAFQRCLSGCSSEVEFEECWSSMIIDYGLKENDWFGQLYAIREKWCTTYNKDYFSAGILSSQISESTNRAIRFNAKKSTNLNEFYTIFKRTVQRWRSTEEVDEFECSRVIPTSRITLTGMLKHASEVYTLSIFKDFEEEFVKSISTTVKVLGEDLQAKMYDVQNHDAVTSHRVNFLAGDNLISCSCKRFEEYGLLCCHCLRILDRNSITQIPHSYILTRWTKFAKKDLWDKIGSATEQSSRVKDCNPWRHEMARKYYNLVLKAQQNEEARTMIEDGYQNISSAVEELMNTGCLIEDTNKSTSSTSVLDPTRAVTKGRKKRIKGVTH